MYGDYRMVSKMYQKFGLRKYEQLQFWVGSPFGTPQVLLLSYHIPWKHVNYRNYPWWSEKSQEVVINNLQIKNRSANIYGLNLWVNYRCVTQRYTYWTRCLIRNLQVNYRKCPCGQIHKRGVIFYTHLTLQLDFGLKKG